jgi:hypothetical protein
METAKSIESERKNYLTIVISGIIIAILIQFLPSFYYQGSVWYWAIDLLLILLLTYVLFMMLVSPEIFNKEFLVVLLYDLDKEIFLPTGLYAGLADQGRRASGRKIIDQDFLESMPKSAQKIEEYAKETEKIVQSLLVDWLHHSVSQFEAPLSRAGSQLIAPLPTKLIDRGIPSLEALETEVKRINPREITKNPYMTTMASIRLPKDAKLEFCERGVRLIHKKMKIDFTVEFRGILSSPSSLTVKYFNKIRSLSFIPDKNPLGDLPKRKLIEVLCVVTFNAVLSRWAKDIHLKLVREMASSLEEFLHWDKIIENWSYP